MILKRPRIPYQTVGIGATNNRFRSHADNPKIPSLAVRNFKHLPNRLYFLSACMNSHRHLSHDHPAVRLAEFYLLITVVPHRQQAGNPPGASLYLSLSLLSHSQCDLRNRYTHIYLLRPTVQSSPHFVCAGDQTRIKKNTTKTKPTGYTRCSSPWRRHHERERKRRNLLLRECVTVSVPPGLAQRFTLHNTSSWLTPRPGVV